MDLPMLYHFSSLLSSDLQQVLAERDGVVRLITLCESCADTADRSALYRVSCDG